MTDGESIHPGRDELACLRLTKAHQLTWPDPGRMYHVSTIGTDSNPSSTEVHSVPAKDRSKASICLVL